MSSEQDEIKEAVSGEDEEENNGEEDAMRSFESPTPYSATRSTFVPESNNQQDFSDMQPSLLSQEVEETQDVPTPYSAPPAAPQYAPSPVAAPQYDYSQYQDQPQYQDQYAGQAYTPDYSQYQQYSSAVSPETMTEIAEQIADEKIHSIKSQIEKVTDFKNTIQTKVDYLDERIKRIERIIDRLQLSILQKVGDYMTNIEDIKKELIETQKSFKTVNSKHHQK